jgi:predicted outer membrane repeat protein
VTITGIDSPTPVSASAGIIVINNSTALAGANVNNNDKLKIKLKSGAFGATVTSTVNVGGVTASFMVSSRPEPKLSLGLDPNLLTLKQGSSGNTNVAIVRQGFAGDVVISVTPTNGVIADALTIAADKTTGVLKLTAATDAKPGQFDVAVNASGGGKSASASIKVTVIGSSPTPISSSGYQNIVALVGKPITAQTPTIMGGTTPYTISIDSALPAGLALDSASGGISGTPSTVAGLKTYTVTISDSSSPVQTLAKTLDITVNPALGLKSAYSNVNGTIGFELKNPGQVLVEGGIPPYNYSIAPVLPAGIIIDAASGKISGKPTVLYASTTHTVTIKDSDGTTVTSPVKVSVSPVPSFVKGYQSLINEVGDPEKLPQTPETSGGALPLSFGISPDLTNKTGIVFDTKTGVIAGLPTKPALEEKYTVTVSDENGASSDTNLRVLILPRFAPKVTNTSIKENQVVNTDLKEIKVSFNKSVNASLSSMTLSCGDQVMLFSGLPIVKSGVATLLLQSGLPQDSLCILTVLKNQVADLLDPPLNMEADFVLTFKTDAAPDVTAFAAVPDGGASANGRVGTNANIKVSFTEPVAVVADGITLVCGASNIDFAGLPATNSNSITVDPSSDLPQDTTCTLTVLKDKVSDTDTADLPDNMNQNRVLTFKTDAAPDVTAFELLLNAAVVPNNIVSTSVDIKASFTEPVAVVAGGITLVCGASNIAFAGLPATNSSSIIIDPTNELPQDSTCTLTVLKDQVSDSDTADLPDNMNQNRVLTFKTDAAPDVTAFELLLNAAVVPNNIVSTSVDIKASFTEPVAVVAGGISLVCGASNIDFTGLPATNSSSIIIDPTNELPQDSTCTLTVLKDQVSDSDTADLPDNMNQNRVLTFKTDAAPTVSGIETTASSDPVQPSRVSVGSNIKVNLSELVSVGLGGMTLVCGETNVTFTGLPTNNSNSATVDPNDDLPQDSDCTLTVLKDSVSDSDSADAPDHMNQNQVFSFKTEQLYGKIDLQMAFDPAQIAYEGAASSANPNERSFANASVTITGQSFPNGQNFSGPQLIEQVLGSSTGLNYTINANDISDGFGNSYKAYFVKNPAFTGFTDCSAPNTLTDTYQVKVNTTTVVKIVFCDPTVVRNVSDGDAASLRSVVAAVTAGTTVTFLQSLLGQTVMLTSGEIVIDKNLNIYGLGKNFITIKPDNSNVVNAPGRIRAQANPVVDKRLFHITGSSASVNLRSLTIKDGLQQNNGDTKQYNALGGCILVDAALARISLSKLALQNCWANGYLGQGGAILFNPDIANRNQNYLSLSEVSMTNNCATNLNNDFNLVCQGVFGNSVGGITPQASSGESQEGNGGAIYLTNGRLGINKSNLSGNHAALFGGAIYMLAEYAAPDPNITWLTIENDSVFDNNTAYGTGGAIDFGGSHIVSSPRIISQIQQLRGDDDQQNAEKIAPKANRKVFGPQVKGTKVNRQAERQAEQASRLQDQRRQTAIAALSAQIRPLVQALVPEVVIKKSTFSNNVTLADTGDFSVDGGALYLENTVATIGETSKFMANSSNDDGGAIYLDNSDAEVSNSSFESNKALGDDGGAIHQLSEDPNAIFTITNSSFTNNEAEDSGGALNVDKATISNTSFMNNKVLDDEGGAIDHDGTGTDNLLTITSSSFEGNQADDDGGGIHTSGQLIINNSTFKKNASVNEEGGAIYQGSDDENKLTIIESTFEENRAGVEDTDEDGGAIYSHSHGSILIDKSLFTKNDASGDGGGIYINIHSTDGEAIVRNSTFSENIADKDNDGDYDTGGGIYLDADCYDDYRCVSEGRLATINNNRIEKNSAVGGGGIYVDMYTGDILDKPVVIIKNNLISKNTTASSDFDTYGGGILVDTTDSPLDIMANTLNENQAQYGAGIYIYGDPDEESSDFAAVNVTNNTISQNIAAFCVGGLYGYYININLHFNTIIDNTNTDDKCPSGVFLESFDDSTYGNILANNSIGTQSDPVFSTPANFVGPLSNVQIEALADNGGPKVGHDSQPLLTRKPLALLLLNQIPCLASVTSDQLGNARATTCDYGALELP